MRSRLLSLVKQRSMWHIFCVKIFNVKTYLFFLVKGGFFSTSESWNLAGWSIYTPWTTSGSANLHVVISPIYHHTLPQLESPKFCIFCLFFHPSMKQFLEKIPGNLFLLLFWDSLIWLFLSIFHSKRENFRFQNVGQNRTF